MDGNKLSGRGFQGVEESGLGDREGDSAIGETLLQGVYMGINRKFAPSWYMYSK